MTTNNSIFEQDEIFVHLEEIGLDRELEELGMLSDIPQ